LEVRYNGANTTLKTFEDVQKLSLDGVTLPNGLQKFSLNRVTLLSIPANLVWPASVESIDLSDNELTEVYTNWPDRMTSLTLRRNRIRHITKLETISSLKELYLESNEIAEVPALPHTLQILELSRNPLRGTETHTWPATLTELHLSKTHQTRVPTNLPTTLKVLTCHDNAIAAFPTVLPESLRYLGLNGNQIVSVPDRITAPQLWNIELIGNNITGLPSTFFLPPSMRLLSLQSNHISALPKNCDWLSKLQELTLSNNRIQYLPRCLWPATTYVSQNNLKELTDMALPKTFHFNDNPALKRISNVTFGKDIYWNGANVVLDDFSLTRQMKRNLVKATETNAYFVPNWKTNEAQVKKNCQGRTRFIRTWFYLCILPPYDDAD
jgi:Leucine-rich repeat (LRR) protein